MSEDHNYDYDYDNDKEKDDYPTAVAAAAYAVRSLKETKLKKHRGMSNGPNKPSAEMRTKSANNEIQPEPLKPTFKLSGETSKRSSRNLDIKLPTSNNKIPENKISSYDSTDENAIKSGKSVFEKVGRPSLSANERMHTNDENSPESPPPKPDPPPVFETARKSETRPGPREAMADAWEKEEMASIKERYERLRATIDNWEIKRKRKADNKLQRREAEPYINLGKAKKSHRNEIEKIEEIVGEARDHAEAKRIKEESKVKEKADKIRSTGKLPTTCFCF